MARVARAGFVPVVLVMMVLTGVAVLGSPSAGAATAPTLALSTTTLIPG